MTAHPPEEGAPWVVIPAYNEAGVIAETISGLRQFFTNIVVVDDCSLDDTAVQACGAGAHVCRHPINLGQGAALKTGIAHALSRGATAVITFDADGQHQPEDARTMTETLVQGGYDVVLSSRFRGTAVGIPRFRRFVLTLAVWFTRLTTGLAVTDAHNGLRVLSRAAAPVLQMRQHRMAHASEILAEIARLNLRWTEVPVTIRYTSYSLAKGQKLSGAVEILKDLLLRGLRS